MSRVMPACDWSFGSGNLSSCCVPSTVLCGGDTRPTRASPWEFESPKGAGRGLLSSSDGSWDSMLAGTSLGALKRGR